MPQSFEEGDEIKKQYMEKVLQANQADAQNAKLTDLFDKNSIIYKAQHPEEEVEEEIKKDIPPPPPTTDNDGYPNLTQVHTFKADLQDIVSKDDLSLSRIAMMQGKANIPTPIKTERSLQSKIYIGVSIFLLFIMIGIVGGIIMLSNQKNVAPVPVAPKERYIIFAESKQEIDITKVTRTEFDVILTDEIKKLKEEDNIKQIIPVIIGDEGKRTATLQEFLDKLGMHTPDQLARVVGQKFFFGLYSKKGRTDPFLIAFTSSYDIAYPNLLDWEGSMSEDFNPVFHTQTRKEDGSFVPLAFKDRVIFNKDARSLETTEGLTSFFYTFLDDYTLLFSKTSDTMSKVITRLREAQFQ